MCDVATPLPERVISSDPFVDESKLLDQLITQAQSTLVEADEISLRARTLVEAVRAGRAQSGGIEEFMSEYQLSSQEGTVLMCLAEALLRIPDRATADKLIADKIGGAAWEKHLGASRSLFVNASTWGLMLTGNIIDAGKTQQTEPAAFLSRLVARVGEPVIRQAMRHAMKIMAGQFVLGRTIKEALEIAEQLVAQGYRFSFDMLGEAAHTQADAVRYFKSYEAALQTLAAWADKTKAKPVFERPSISIKLSAIHPRYEEAKLQRLKAELVPQLIDLAGQAAEHNLGLTIDAEEMDRLDLSLDIFTGLATNPRLESWQGLGLAVQGYSRRALPVLKWLYGLGEKTGRKIPLRLVKGAYWDTEIKRAQEQGLPSYPVFTRKASTDVSYLACARYLLDHRDHFYPQFASHNAQTIAAVSVMAGNKAGFECQRLHGMGKALYDEIIDKDGLDLPARIYAPVGSHEDLLAYLVRRLLENGANSSFVHRLNDDALPISQIIADPVAKVEALKVKPHPQIPQPRDIFSPRKSAKGYALWHAPTRQALMNDIKEQAHKPVDAGAIVNGEVLVAEDAQPVSSPQARKNIVGNVRPATSAQVEQALTGAQAAQLDWCHCGGAERAQILRRAADLFEDHTARFLSLLIFEAGKTLENALADLREAVDFLRYYADQAEEKFSRPQDLPGPTGETNKLSLKGRGVFVCISPWNFPLAIFTGQIGAALAAGNAVVAKPAEQTPLIAFEAVQLLHKAGVPVQVLQFLPGSGATIGAELVAHPATAGIAFTGSTQTANLINQSLAARPGPIVPLIAETGGMNAMFADSTALPEQIVTDVLKSAFDSAGQRCSAARILFIQQDIAAKTITMLAGAMQELQIGDPADYATDIGPVIDDDAKGTLLAHKAKMAARHKTIMDLNGEGTRGNKGIEAKGDGTFVAPAAYLLEDIADLNKEVFGPILHVVPFAGDRLEEVCDSLNAKGFGLTCGIHTRIETTAHMLGERIKAGNVYVNRNQIGAVVGSQPFGGQGLSGTGPKAGGPHYLTRFANEKVVTTDMTASGGNAALLSLSSE